MAARALLAAVFGCLALLLDVPNVRDARTIPGIRSAAAQPYAAPLQRGISLGLFSEDPLWSYEDLLKEIKALGATHVELVAAYYQRDGSSAEIGEHPRFSAPTATIVRTIRQAHRLGLKVMLFPILRLSSPRPGEWRGTLRPADPTAWWRSYERLILRLAALAQAERVELFSVGSELSTLDTDRSPWARLVGQVRRRYRGVLTYSGNWDHYDKVAIYDLLDQAGVCGYFKLAERTAPPPYPVPALVQRWEEEKRALLRFVGRIGRPLLFTEVGYLSQRGAAAYPWEESARGPVDLEDQRRAYEAFVTVWQGTPALVGVYFWNWYGWGGATSRGYTPRGKPAAEEIRRYFAAPSAL